MAKLSINVVCIDCQEQMKVEPTTGWPGLIASFGKFGVDHNNDSGACKKMGKKVSKVRTRRRK